MVKINLSLDTYHMIYISVLKAELKVPMSHPKEYGESLFIRVIRMHSREQFFVACIKGDSMEQFLQRKYPPSVKLRESFIIISAAFKATEILR